MNCSFSRLQTLVMATFFGEVVTGSYRYIDPDHPDYNDTRAAPQAWSLADKILSNTSSSLKSMALQACIYCST